VRLTVLGCGPASPQPDTPASGLLVESGATAILLDCGQGVAAGLAGRIEPSRLSAVIVGHMHADHFIDLSALRYRFDWGERSAERLPVLLPPGGAARLAALAGVISERDGFFDDAFDIREYDPDRSDRIGELEVDYVPGRHYVPAWGASLRAADGTRIVYAGDTGPNPKLVERARGAELLVCEATLERADEDDPGSRGHLSLDEAIEHAGAAGVERALITHYPSARREAMLERLATVDARVGLARPGLVVTVPPVADGGSTPGPAGSAASHSMAAARAWRTDVDD